MGHLPVLKPPAVNEPSAALSTSTLGLVTHAGCREKLTLSVSLQRAGGRRQTLPH